MQHILAVSKVHATLGGHHLDVCTKFNSDQEIECPKYLHSIHLHIREQIAIVKWNELNPNFVF